MEKITLTGLLPEDIGQSLELKQNFRSLQIFKWIYVGAESFDQMTNLSKDDRALLSEKAQIYSSRISQVLKDPDGTIKLQIELSD